MCSSACVPGIIALSYLSTSLPLGVFTTISSSALQPSAALPTSRFSLSPPPHRQRLCPVSFSRLSVSTVLLTEACKKGTHRERPLHGTIHLRRFNLRSLLTNFSFPSGDSAQAGVLGLAFFLYASAQQHALAPLWLTLIPAVMFSRVYFGCHWIGDVLVGAGIGVGVTGALWLLWCRALGLPMPHAAATTVIKEMIS